MVGEGATLAHFARPMALAQALPPELYEVVLACPAVYRLWSPPGIPWRDLEVQPPARFFANMALGRPLFDRSTMERYIAHDRQLISSVQPDLIIGDARLSLAASARETGRPYIAVTNAYYDPSRPLPVLAPCLKWTGAIPLPLLELAAHALFPVGQALNAAPIAAALKSHGIDGLGLDIRRIWTEADLTLYADLPALAPGVTEGPRRRFLGPIAWEPPVELPGWWGRLPKDAPLAYVALGSSGDARRLPMIIDALVRRGFAVMAATAGRMSDPTDGKRVFARKFLPGVKAAARADLVVCNGGSLGAGQGLAAGRPVLGVCTNLDQHLNMRAVESAGAGIALRSDRIDQRRLDDALDRVAQPEVARAAADLAREAAGFDMPARLLAAVEAALGLAALRPSPDPVTGRAPEPFAALAAKPAA